MTSKHKLNFIDLELEKFKENNIYRKLKYSSSQGSHITINGKKLLNLCSNDYLGIPITKIQTTQALSVVRSLFHCPIAFESDYTSIVLSNEVSLKNKEPIFR